MFLCLLCVCVCLELYVNTCVLCQIVWVSCTMRYTIDRCPISTRIGPYFYCMLNEKEEIYLGIFFFYIRMCGCKSYFSGNGGNLRFSTCVSINSSSLIYIEIFAIELNFFYLHLAPKTHSCKSLFKV